MAEPFLVLGAMKSGTTTLDSLLRAHPDVDVVAQKEGSQLNDPRTAAGLAARIGYSKAVRAGEVTAGYLQAPLLPQPVDRALQLLGPQVALVVIVRDPLDRAISHWQHLRQLGRENRGLDEALLDGDAPYQAFSRYHEQLQPWLDTFGSDRLHLLCLEDYHGDPARVVGRLWDFLGVERQRRDLEPVHANAAATRVVATGWRNTVSQSGLYRRGVRPLIGPRVRRRLAAGLGGARGRESATPSDDAATAFYAAVAADSQQLSRVWPHLRWLTT